MPIDREQQELIADMIYESELIIMKDADIWDYCLELAERILNELDVQASLKLPTWKDTVIRLVNEEVPADLLNKEHIGGAWVKIIRIKHVRQLGYIFPSDHPGRDYEQYKTHGTLLGIRESKQFVEENWK